MIIVITVVSVVGVSTYIAMLLTRQLVEEEIYRKALAQARSTGHQLVNEHILESPQDLARTLRQMEHDVPDVKQSDVYLHAAAHHLIATTAAKEEHLELDNVPNIEGYFEFERPEEDTLTIETPDGKFWIMGISLRDRGWSVACLNVKVSKSRSSLVTRNLVARNLLLMLASLAVVILVIHVLLLKWVRRPVKEMVRVMEAAEGGELQVRARVSSRDEIGQLAAHLNRMLTEIENFNAELGRRVQDATGELGRRNEELKHINEELFETQKNLARSERLAIAGQLAASLAHEIGTPLNSISGHVQLLARRKTGDQTADRRLLIIEKQIENIVRTVKQFLSLTRKFDLQIEPLNLRHILEESLLLSSPALELKKIRVQAEFAEDCPAVYGDAGYLQQVFLNLINNSMDAMPRGGTLRVGVRHAADGDVPQVAIELADTGSGIPPEMLAHIFEPMFTTKRVGTGAGLGLTICDQIIRRHGGTVQVESEVGRGTCFTVLLPVDCRRMMEAAVATAGSFAMNGTG